MGARRSVAWTPALQPAHLLAASERPAFLPAFLPSACLQKLASLQGTCIPRLLGMGELALGFTYIALSLIPGKPLCELGRIPDGVAAAARRALKDLHACGVEHGDMQLQVRGLPGHAS